jgi:diacylglycerol kinase family enzyme
MPAPSAVVVLNPQAAAGCAATLRRPVTAWLARHAPGVSLLTPDGVHAAKAMLTILAPRTRVVLIGGDGTLHAMLPAALKGGLRLGLVPAGRHNRIARALGLDTTHWAEALNFALHAPTAPVDVGLLETEDLLVHVIGAIRLDSQTAMTLWIDSQRCRPARSGSRRSLQLCNAGPDTSTPLAPDHGPPIEINDGRFDVLALPPPAGRWRHLLQRALPGTPMPPPFEHHQGRDLRVECDSLMAIRADGEPLTPSTRLHLQMLPRALELTGSHVAMLDPHRFVDTTW